MSKRSEPGGVSRLSTQEVLERLGTVSGVYVHSSGGSPVVTLSGSGAEVLLMFIRDVAADVQVPATSDLPALRRSAVGGTLRERPNTVPVRLSRPVVEDIATLAERSLRADRLRDDAQPTGTGDGLELTRAHGGMRVSVTAASLVYAEREADDRPPLATFRLSPLEADALSDLIALIAWVPVDLLAVTRGEKLRQHLLGAVETIARGFVVVPEVVGQLCETLEEILFGRPGIELPPTPALAELVCAWASAFALDATTVPSALPTLRRLHRNLNGDTDERA